jgi:sporulation protein YlmC with PRC-barrel domain
MALYSNLRDYQFGNDTEDIRGAKVYGADNEKLGEIKDVIFDNRTGDVRYVVVDTGGWLTSMEFVIPARQLMIREEGDEDFRVNLTKKQVEKLPEYRAQDVESEERWNDYENRYEAAWTEDPVLHREGSTHTITPDPSEDPVKPPSGVVFKNATPRRIAHDEPRFGATSDSDHAIGTHDLVGQTELEPINTEYTGVDAVIPLQASEEPVQVSRTEFNKDAKMGPARASETATRRPPAETEKMDSERADSDGGRRFREFQERLRREREQILRKRREAA